MEQKTMEGILLTLDRAAKKGTVDSRNDEVGVLTIFFGDNQPIPDEIQENCSVYFEVKTSARGNTYAKFLSAAERNQAVFNTEDRDQWYTWGEDKEADFVAKVVPHLDVDIRINPEKAERAWAIDLFDYTHQRPADLKVQNTPFFTCGSAKHSYRGKRYDPTYTVTFNKKDYENYREKHPDCDIYFWVNWTQLEYASAGFRTITVRPLRGVWRASFAKMCELIESGAVSLHEYQHRKNDDHNAQDSYLFMLNDESVFERLL